jgi:Na+/H+ antiporter NhaD/arsenite permease-like protein
MTMQRYALRGVCAAAAVLIPEVALAAPHAAGLDGAAMRWPWALPFIGVLLSIATGPLLFPKIWHAHYGKIAFGWSLLALIPMALTFGMTNAAAAFMHTALAEYMSFIILLLSLYVVAGGILVTGTLPCTAGTNVSILTLGAVLASFVGTTGAAMIMVRPLIRANAKRPFNAHVVIFFILLVANIGGGLTPLGDPPLFVGFLHGVDFFWPVQHVWLQTLITGGLVLAIFACLEIWQFKKHPVVSVKAGERLGLRGKINILLIGVIIAAILMSAQWKPGVAFTVLGTEVELQNLARDGILILTALASLWLTPAEHREANDFTWEPIREVAILFAGIFCAIIPVMAMLKAGHDGTFAFLLKAVTANDGTAHEAAYFWLTGGLSAFLDNAPTYLVFFELAGGKAAHLMGPLAGTLASISMGAVFMGALTYIGNAPNLMVYAIATERGVKMPSFFGYMAWAFVVLIPIFILLTVLPISPILKLP